MVTGSWWGACKAALRWRWNLLFLGVSAALGIISGKPDVVLPIAGAVEIAYLALLSTNERYQKLVAAREYAGDRPQDADAGPSLGRILAELQPADRARYERLGALCRQLQRIGGEGPDSLGVRELPLEDLNRLLWIYLRLLLMKGNLERFFRTVDEGELRADLERARERLAALDARGGDPAATEKLRETIRDTAATTEQRLANHARARANYEQVQLELERLHTKIAGIAEMGVGRHETGAIGREIDLVTASIGDTERSVRDMESVAGVSFGEAPPLSLLGAPPAAPARRGAGRVAT